MQEWEYLEIYVLQAEPGQGGWADSQGRAGKLDVVDAEGVPIRWNTSARALDSLGRQGWELVSVVQAGGNNHRFFLKRPRAGAMTAEQATPSAAI